MFRFKTLAAAAAAALAAASAQAADHTMLISSWTGPNHGINAQMWPNFIKMMEDATDGRVTGEVKLGLAPPPAQMDLVLDGAADMAIIFHGYQPGRFATTKLIELPGYEGSAATASAAYWKVFEEHLSAANEHRGVKVVALHTHGPAQLHTTTQVTSLDQVEGLKLRVPGGVGSDVGEALGAVGIQVPAPKVYETIASNAADGVVIPMESRKGFNLVEIAPYVYRMPGGLYRGSFAFIMNMDTWESLPEDVQQALEENVFGEPASRMLGGVWDGMDEEGLALTNATEGNEIVDASPEDVAAYEPIKTKIIEGVLAEIAATGVDAQAAYEMVKSEMAGATN
jgi:TRAP-type C4-dicarboxylate transport system substrate-binding protein